MLKNINLLLIAFYLLTLSTQIFAGGFYSGSNHLAVKHNAFSRHKSKHSSPSFAKHNLKFHRKWHHKTKYMNKIKFPYYALYGIGNQEKEKNVEINIINIVDDKKDEQIESTVNKKKSFSSPRIVNLEDVAPNKTKNVILIYGTKIIETKISSD